MSTLPGRPTSLWLATNRELPSQPLSTSEFDVVIIGAGIAGVMTAHFLAGKGLSVAVIESHRIFTGVTGNTTGKLTSQHGLMYKRLIDSFGKEKAQAYADANQWAIRFAKDWTESNAVDCSLIAENAHIYALTEKEWPRMEAEADASRDLGLPAELVRSIDAPIPMYGALQFTNQARFHPLRFLTAVLKDAESRGIQVSENTRAFKVEEDTEECRIETNRGEIRAKNVVISTHYPILDSGWFVAKLAPYRSYAIAVRLNQPVPDGMFINESEPMRSWRKHEDETGEYLIVGGQNHKVGQDQKADQNYLELESWAKEYFPVKEVAFRWSTQDNWTPDGLPFVGRSPDKNRLFVATGFAGWGMSNGIVSGKILSDEILAIQNPWAETYNPSRQVLTRLGTLVKENINVASHLIGDRAARAEFKNWEEVQPGQAGILQLPDKRVAAYRSADGVLHAVESACSHMGCQVAWNSAENSWDCPCHGSRFSIDGDVLHGPAVSPLAQVDAAKESSVGHA